MNTRVSSPARTEMLDKLWDYGHVEWALLDYVHREAALLVGPVDELLTALARPPHPRQFLVAAIAPPGTDGVWTPEQTGCFLDYVEQDRLYMLWQIIAFRGTRRGEVCGVRWEDRSRSTRTLAIATQLVQDNWDVYEGAPKTDSGIRLIALDEETDQGLDTHRIRQQQEREAWGEGWVDTGRIFTQEDGSLLHPGKVSDLFERLVEAAGLPPIRLHDLRHVGARRV